MDQAGDNARLGRLRVAVRLIGNSNVIPLIGFKSLNPIRHWTIDARYVFGMHRFLGTTESLGLKLDKQTGLYQPRRAPRRRTATGRSTVEHRVAAGGQ